MLKRLISAILITALLAPGCGGKKSGAPATGSGSASGSGAGAAAPPGDPAMAPGPAVVAATAVATTAQQTSAASSQALAAAPPAARATQVGKLIDAAIALETNDARDRSWDPASVITKVGTDRAKLFAWVHDQTALVPYAGMLRGAVGVMMDRVGNSLDRALLLADLLAHTGAEVRLAHATLDPAVADRLAAAWSKVPKPAFPMTPDAAPAADLLALLGGDPAAVTRGFAAQKVALAELDTKARAQITAQAGALAKLVEGTPPAAPADAAVLADHWWVQVKDGDVWSDLDPTQAKPGETLATATETPARDAIPDSLRHMLAVRVIGEVWHGETREETMLVEHAFTPAEFYGQQLVVTTIPVDLPEATTLDAAKDRLAAARTAIIAQTEWMPMIRMGTKPIVKDSVTDTGDIYDLTEGNDGRLARFIHKATQNGVGGATDLLEGMPDGTDQAPAPKPVAGPHAGFTAEWIELEVRAPNVAPRIIRRTVFDALGAPADRNAAKPVALADPAKLDRGLALMGDTEILAQFARLPRGYAANRIATYLTAAKPTIVALVQNGGKDPPEAVVTPLRSALPPPSELDQLAYLRFAWGPDAVFVDQLDVLTAPRRLVSLDRTLRTRQAFDIVTNGVGSWGAPAQARTARLAQGIADTVAESVVRPCLPADDRCFRGPNTSDAFTGAKGWPVITDPASPAVAALPSAARIVATADLANGFAIVPAPHAATWWRVRLDTGETLGQGAAGGTASTDYSLMLVWLKTFTMAAGWAGCALGTSGTQQVACAVLVSVGGVGSFVLTGAMAQAILGAVLAAAGLLATQLPH